MAQLYDILLTAGVQETFADKLRDDGWTTELYAMCASTQENFKDELAEMLGTFHAVTTPIQRSAMTLAWHRCRQSLDQSTQSSSSQPAAPVEATTPAASWSETFPPKLTGEVVAALKQKFKQNYPAGILLPETMPSLRLLSLMHHQKTKNEFRWGSMEIQTEPSQVGPG